MDNIGQQLDTVPTIDQLLNAVEKMRNDLHQVHSRISLMERSVAEVRNQQLRKKVDINILEYIFKISTLKCFRKHFSDFGTQESPVVAVYADISRVVRIYDHMAICGCTAYASDSKEKMILI